MSVTSEAVVIGAGEQSSSLAQQIREQWPTGDDLGRAGGLAGRPGIVERTRPIVDRLIGLAADKLRGPDGEEPDLRSSRYLTSPLPDGRVIVWGLRNGGVDHPNDRELTVGIANHTGHDRVRLGQLREEIDSSLDFAPDARDAVQGFLETPEGSSADPVVSGFDLRLYIGTRVPHPLAYESQQKTGPCALAEVAGTVDAGNGGHAQREMLWLSPGDLATMAELLESAEPYVPTRR